MTSGGAAQHHNNTALMKGRLTNVLMQYGWQCVTHLHRSEVPAPQKSPLELVLSAKEL